MSDEVFVSFQPIGKRIQIEKETNILEAARKAGIRISAVCGGESRCGSCRIKILEDNPPVSEPSPTEYELLDKVDLESGIRLACHTEILGNLEVTIPPESFSQSQRLQVEGHEVYYDLDPAIQIVDLRLDPDPHQTDLSLFDELAGLLQQKIGSKELFPEVEMLRKLPEMVRQFAGEIRVLIRKGWVIDIRLPLSPVLGCAVDVGTTKLAAYLVDLESGEILSKLGTMNPQISFGEDVMARIAYAGKQEDGLDLLHTVLVDSLNDLVSRLCEQANQERLKPNIELNPEQVIDAVIVGNTLMHHTALKLPVKQLGVAPYRASLTSAIDVKAKGLGIKVSPVADIHFMPNIAGFVGADHVSMLLTGDKLISTSTILFIDIGTNTEVSLTRGDLLISCSTASGPAFEGAHIGSGMRAVDGAIEKFFITEDGFKFLTVAQGKPSGICGSGILDILAQSIKHGIINRNGALNKEHPGVRIGDKGPELLIVKAEEAAHNRDIVMSRKDISEIQLAKGAIRAGIELLIKEVGIAANEIEQVVVAGAFGTYLDVNSAVTIGMFPDIDRSRFIQVGNAAGMGAITALLSIKQRENAIKMAKEVRYLELANHPDFSNEFTMAMMF